LQASFSSNLIKNSRRVFHTISAKSLLGMWIRRF